MQKTNLNSLMKTAKAAAVLFLSILSLGAISMSLVACNNDDSEESPEIIDKSPAQAIDLGLPSGTLWASCNVGATKPEEYGLYFAWGETKGYTSDTSDGHSFDWANYKWCNGSSSSLTKYNRSDGKKELDLEDDAAYVNWGSNWRMPSLDQIEELIDNCNWEWTALNGVYGRKATSKKNGKSIFLPAAGGREMSSLGYAGESGLYWSRTRGVPLYEAQMLGFYSEHEHLFVYPRCIGRSVRPVRR